MAQGMIPVGRLQVATPKSMALAIRQQTEAQAAVDERIQDVAADIIASDETVVQAAADAAAAEIAARDLVEGKTVPAGNTNRVGVAVPFADGSRNALEVDDRGRPTPLSASLHVEVEAPLMGAVLGVETRTDINMPGVRALFAFEDDSIAGAWMEDGSFVAAGGGWSPTPPGGSGLVAYGDSTTEGADLSDRQNERWSKLLGDLIGTPITNRGVSGARAEEIAARLGGITITGTVTGGMVPASGAVTLTGLAPADPWRAWDNAAAYSVIALTDAGQLIEGTLHSDPDGRYFTRAGAGSVTPTAMIETRAVVDVKQTLFLGIGINNKAQIEDGDMTVDELCALYTAVTSTWEGRMLIWGVLDRGLAEGPETVWGKAIRALEAWLEATYGVLYVPVRRYLASPQALTDALIFDPAFTPSADDLAAQAADTVPPCFRANAATVHLNALGHQLQARLIHRAMLMRGLTVAA